ncbi:hypothetical protein TCAL_15596 [Tigriopus californicus]|uniref:Resistance to inhibitors of cholinesterase protein 3 N-terminal domain-containing protein n=1 Tax=Tigriopus californicus TaxID=6832 RepID=A0A553PBH8_TIGCA|nr:resistance to inhibitors of cholinesterase protein 3-like [Tigriopus californicus]TRY75030.1 hypothetical protein TCAL_15596 [Tigriopus californicus]
MASEIGAGKSIMVVAIVLGCFAILWPKVFYPMLFDTYKGFAGAPVDSHLKQVERDPRMGPQHRHPRFSGDDGKELRRTLEKDLKPGPVPGMRPTMGGPGIQPQGHKGQGGAMGILMPLYTVGIVIFFLYTVMKIIFKKNDDDYPPPSLTPEKRVRRPDYITSTGSRKSEGIQEISSNGSDVRSPLVNKTLSKSSDPPVKPRPNVSPLMSSCASCKTCQEELLAAVADAASACSNLDARSVPDNAKEPPNIEGKHQESTLKEIKTSSTDETPRPKDLTESNDTSLTDDDKLQSDSKQEIPKEETSDAREEELKALRAKLQQTEELMKMLASKVESLQTTEPEKKIRLETDDDNNKQKESRPLIAQDTSAQS